MGRRYKCPYCDKRDERGKLITHIDKVHKDMLPENYSGARIMYDTINKIVDGHGRCRVCKQPTEWNEKTSRYDTLCDNPKCKEHMREEYKKNMLRVRGTYNILNDPEQQQKMLANRSISGTYKYSDGTIFTYTGSYEKKFLEFMDTVLEVPSKDILMPGPTLEYTYKGKKHMYLTDALYLPYTLIVEIKDGGDNINGKDSPGMIASREKTIAKEKLITDKGEYNYIRLTDNNFAQLIEIFMSLKMNALNGDDSKIVRINESYDYDNLTKFSAYHLEYKRDCFNKDKPHTWDEELYSKNIDSAIKNDILGKHDLKDKKSIEAYVYTTTKDLKPIYLGIISVRLFDNNGFDWEWSEQEPLDKDVYDNIMNNPIEESLYYNLSKFDPFVQQFPLVPTKVPDFMKDNNLHESVDLNSKGLYHISKSKNITNMKPEVPDNFMTKHGYEDAKTPRVCFAPSINQCIMGLSRNCTDEEFYVYMPDGEYKTRNATIEEVPDSKITGEVWITEPVKVKCVGKIKVIGDKGDSGYKYKYGGKYTAELYDWEWKQIPMNEHNDSLDALRYSYEVLNSVKDPLGDIKSYNGIYNESNQKSHIDNNFKNKSGGNFKYLSIHDSEADKYLSKNKYYKNNFENIKSITNGEIVIDTDKDKLAGYIYIGAKGKNKGFIQTLEVIKEYRGYGLSHKLLEDAINKYNAIDLTVTKDNDVAIRLYKKHGFVCIDYGDPRSSREYYMKLKSKLSKDDKIINENYYI